MASQLIHWQQIQIAGKSCKYLIKNTYKETNSSITYKMEQEIWKSIIKNKEETGYEVSNLGNIRNTIRPSKILKPSLRSGYQSICISRNEKCKIHREVAIAFLPNDDVKKKFVNHIDGNKMNNKLDNLEWVTPTQNVKHAIDNKLIKVTERRVTKIDPDTKKEIETYQSLKIASEKTGTIDSAIIKSCKGINNKAGGYIWKYTDVNNNEQENIDLTEYKQLKDFPNYRISKEGKVYSIPYKKFLKFQLNNDGYPHVQLTNKGKKKDYLVHRLVAELFVNNPDPKTKVQVNHIDMDKTNFNSSNLEWTTGSENMKHSYITKKKQIK
jgi:hypothetical protein